MRSRRRAIARSLLERLDAVKLRRVKVRRTGVGEGCSRRLSGATASARNPDASGVGAAGTALARPLAVTDVRAHPIFIVACLVLLGATASAEEAALRWSRLPVPGLGTPLAAALDATGTRFAVGDERGAYRWQGGAAPARLLRRGPVHDLLFRADGTLYAATGGGLFRIDPRGRVDEVALGSGLRAQRVTRLAALGGLLAAGTERGAYVTRDGQHWSRLDGSLPQGRVDSLALGLWGGRVWMWLVLDGRLYSAAIERGPLGDVAVDVERHLAAEGGDRRGALDVVSDVGGFEVVVLVRELLVVREEGAWRTVRPGFPPGANALRLGGDREEIWVATDRGLLRGARADRPLERAAPPASTAPTTVVAVRAGRALSAGPRGILEGRAATALAGGEAPLGGASLAERSAREPSVQQVHAAALRYLGLTRQRIRGLERGVARRGWLPFVDLRGALGAATDIRRDYDQIYSGGDVRHLFDRQHDRGTDYGASLTLSWDLGDVLYHPEAIDVSREAREVIELRDEVLDEITRFYFDRQRVVAELYEAVGEAERTRLRLRADELAAGLDAWTGGWFGQKAAPLLSRHEPTPAVPEEKQP